MLSAKDLVLIENNVVKSTKDAFRVDGNLISFLLDTAANYGEKEILLDTNSNRVWKAKEIVDATRNLSKHLVKIGISKGDVVAFYSTHNDYHTIALLSVALIGGVYTGGLIDWEPVREIQQTLCKTSAKYVIVDYKKRDMIKQCLETNKQIEKIFTLDDVQDAEIISVPNLIKTPFTDSNIEKTWSLQTASVRPNDLIMINFSSGTTGKPKTVPHTHDNFASMISMGDDGFLYMEHDDVTSMDEPYTHVVGMQFLTLALYKGTKMIFYGRVDCEAIISNLRVHGITAAFFVPAQLVELNETFTNEGPPLKLKKVLVAGEVLTKRVALEFIEKFKPQYLGQNYGCTEALVHTQTPLVDGVLNLTSAGIPNYGVSLKVVDEAGNPLPANQKGRIYVKTRGLMSAYLDDEEATKKNFDKDGFLDTGDIGCYDDRGYLYFMGRDKDTIKFDTMQISPAEIEDVLNNHPAVSESVVVGIPDEKYGELPKAFILLRETFTKKVTSQELIDFAAAQTSDWKILRGGVTFVDRFPRTKLGKIDRKTVKTWISDLQSFLS